MNQRLQRVHLASLRVALMASAVFAVVYAIVAVLIVVLVTNNLMSQVDARLTSDLSSVQNGHGLTAVNSAGTFAEPGGHTLGNPVFWWLSDSDGSQQTNAVVGRTPVTLPAPDLTVTTPSTVPVMGQNMRLAGATVDTSSGPVHVVLAQNIESVVQTQSTITFIEVVVGLILLVVAFVGALIGGRRVGAPIELARQRQMEFTADASHELRTPLSVIEAQTSLALSQVRDPAWYRSAFERIGHESGRIRRLVEDLLWLARVDSAPSMADAEPVELGVLARQAVDRFAAVAETRGLTLTVDVSDEPHIVTGSPEWLDRLLGVLVDNACKYTPEHGAVIVRVAHDGGRVGVAVEDAGPGIPPAERPRIFERFHRATSSKPGAGLGLAIADAVVRRTQGRWEVGTSTALGGASVGVTWPRTGSAREAARAPAPAGAAAPAPPPLT